jgi:hypothetical protein
MTEKNVFQSISEDLLDRAARQANKIKKHYEDKKVENKYWQDLKEDADEAVRLMADPRYPRQKKYLETVLKELEDGLRSISRNFKDYDREARADASMLILAQIDFVLDLIERPEKVIERIKGQKQ